MEIGGIMSPIYYFFCLLRWQTSEFMPAVSLAPLADFRNFPFFPNFRFFPKFPFFQNF